jgi:hypothetical protein
MTVCSFLVVIFARSPNGFNTATAPLKPSSAYTPHTSCSLPHIPQGTYRAHTCHTGHRPSPRRTRGRCPTASRRAGQSGSQCSTQTGRRCRCRASHAQNPRALVIAPQAPPRPCPAPVEVPSTSRRGRRCRPRPTRSRRCTACRRTAPHRARSPRCT